MWRSRKSAQVMEAAITSPCWENQAKDEEIPWMASRDHGKVWVRRDLKAHPIPKNPTGQLPSSQVAPIPIQTLPRGSHSFSRLGRSSGNGCELCQPQLLSGRFLPGMFSHPRLRKSSLWQGFGVKHELWVCPDVNPRIPSVPVPSRASPKPFPKVVFTPELFGQPG